MTIKELFNSCDFAEVADEIAIIDPRQAGMLYCYKELFDMHRLADGEPCESVLEVNSHRVNNCHEVGDYQFPNMEISTMDDAKDYSNARLAAEILWERTFFGFGEDELPRFIIDKILQQNENGKKAFELSKERYIGLCGTKKLKDEVREDLKDAIHIGFTQERWYYFEKREKTCSEKTKEWIRKIDAEIRRLKRRSRVEYLIQRLTTNAVAGRSMTAEELGFLYDTKLICEHALRSYTNDENARCGYIKDLLNWNFGDELQYYSNAVIHVITSPDHPLRDDESLDFIKSLFPESADIKWTFSHDPERGRDIKVFIAAYNNENE